MIGKISRILIPVSLVFIAGLYISACSSYQVKNTQYSLPDPIDFHSNLEPHEKALVIASVNDMNGQLEGIENMGIQIGGINLVRSYIEILRSTYPNQVLTLSAGNLFAIPQDLRSASHITSELESLKFDGVGMSTSDFEVFRQNKPSNLALINSNIFEIQSGNLFQSGTIVPHGLIQRGDLTLGIVSVAAPKKDLVYSGYFFEDLAASYLRALTFLRRNNTNITILILNADSGCSKESLADELQCLEQGHLAKLVDRLPPKSIDLILTTGEYFGYGQYKDILILNSPGNGLYLNTLFLVYDTKAQKINHQKTILQQPTLLCESFFQLTKDCYLGDSRRLNEIHKDKQKTQQARFLGQPIEVKDK